MLPTPKSSRVLLYLCWEDMQVDLGTVPEAGWHANILVAVVWWQLLLCLLRRLHRQDGF